MYNYGLKLYFSLILSIIYFLILVPLLIFLCLLTLTDVTMATRILNAE